MAGCVGCASGSTQQAGETLRRAYPAYATRSIPSAALTRTCIPPRCAPLHRAWQHTLSHESRRGRGAGGWCACLAGSSANHSGRYGSASYTHTAHRRLGVQHHDVAMENEGGAAGLRLYHLHLRHCWECVHARCRVPRHLLTGELAARGNAQTLSHPSTAGCELGHGSGYLYMYSRELVYARV
jgi:hypothetical protein